MKNKLSLKLTTTYPPITDIHLKAIDIYEVQRDAYKKGLLC